MLCKVVSSLSEGASNPEGRMCLACDTERSRQVSIPNLRQSILIEWAKVGLERPLSFLMAFYCSAATPPQPQLSWRVCKLGSGAHCDNHHDNNCSRRSLSIVHDVFVTTGTGSYKPPHSEGDKGVHSVVSSQLTL